MALTKQEVDASLLMRFSPLDDLEHDKLAELASKSSLIEFGRGETVGARLVKNGTVFLVSGAVDRAPGSDNAETIKAKTERSRRAILSPKDRTRVVAKTDVSVLCVDSELLDFLRSWDGGATGPDTGIIVDEIEADSVDWVDGLMRSDVIANLSPSSIQALMAAIESVEVDADETIFNQGDAPDYYYIVSSGSCVVTRRDPGLDGFVDLAALGPGDAFGEEALITNAPRNATVRMVEKGTVLRLRQSDFKRMLEQPLVKTVDHDQLVALKAKGAAMLYIDGGESAECKGEGDSVAISKLREYMQHLDKARTYVVTSDDSRISASAAFILAQKRYDVCVVAAGLHRQSAPKTDTVSSPPVSALENVAARLEKELEAVKAKLQEEQKSHAAAKDRVRTLETDLQTTRAGAKAAINAASDLKNQSESLLRQQIKEITRALQNEKEKCQNLAKQTAELYQQLSQLQNELNASREQGHQLREESLGRESALTDTIQQLEQALAEQDERLQQLQSEHESLQESHGELENRHDVLLGEKRSLEEQHRDLEERFSQLGRQRQALQEQQTELEVELQQRGAEVESLRSQHCELQRSYEELGEEHQALAGQLDELDGQLQHRAQLMEGLQGEVNDANSRADGFEGALQALQLQHSELQSSLERAEQQNIELEKARNELYMQVMSVTNEAREQASAAQVQRNALEKEIEGLNTTLDSTKDAFSSSEADYKQKIGKLRNELTDANQKLVQMTARATQQESDIRLLNDETDALRSAKKRRGVLIAALSVLFLFASAAVVASFVGVDLKSTAMTTIDQMKQLVDRIATLSNGSK